MPVEQLPGFWDYLSQGLDKFAQQKQVNTTNARNAALDKRAAAGQGADLMTSLFNAGAVNSDQVGPAISAVTGTPVTVNPNKAQQRRQLLAQGPDAIAALSDPQKQDLGFPTSTEQAQQGAAKSTALLDTQKTDLYGKYLQGDDLPQQTLDALGLQSKTDRELKRVSQIDPYLGSLGERYVAGELLKNQGRVPPGGANGVAENAYAKYVSERSANGLGSLTPEQVTYTRTYFQRATENALIAQHKMDIEQMDANTRQTAAGGSEAVKWFTQVNTALENVRKAQSDLMRANPALGAALDNPQLASNPMVSGALTRYNQLEQTAEAFRGAQGSLAAGNVPGNLSALLDAATQVVTAGAPKAAAGGGGRQAGGRPGAAPPPAPPAGGPPGPNPITNGDPIEAAAQMLASGQGTSVQLQAMVSQGALTQDQYNKIMKRAAILAKKPQQ